jgi:hypothetical protein
MCCASVTKHKYKSHPNTCCDLFNVEIVDQTNNLMEVCPHSGTCSLLLRSHTLILIHWIIYCCHNGPRCLLDHGLLSSLTIGIYTNAEVIRSFASCLFLSVLTWKIILSIYKYKLDEQAHISTCRKDLNLNDINHKKVAFHYMDPSLFQTEYNFCFQNVWRQLYWMFN